jgi:ketosteroid isomerase-like protein
MRKLLFATAFLLFAGTACDHVSKTAPPDIAAEETALNNDIDKFNDALTEQDVTTMASFICEDALICGSDPSEFWNKQQIIDEWTRMLTDTVPETEHISDRRVLVAPDGNSAYAVEQFMFPNFNIPWRFAYHFVKTNDKWMILFLNITVVPKNEDLAKIHEAVE